MARWDITIANKHIASELQNSGSDSIPIVGKSDPTHFAENGK